MPLFLLFVSNINKISERSSFLLFISSSMCSTNTCGQRHHFCLNLTTRFTLKGLLEVCQSYNEKQKQNNTHTHKVCTSSLKMSVDSVDSFQPTLSYACGRYRVMFSRSVRSRDGRCKGRKMENTGEKRQSAR